MIRILIRKVAIRFVKLVKIIIPNRRPHGYYINHSAGDCSCPLSTFSPQMRGWYHQVHINHPERELNGTCQSDDRWMPAGIINEKNSTAVGDETVFMHYNRQNPIPTYSQCTRKGNIDNGPHHMGAGPPCIQYTRCRHLL